MKQNPIDSFFKKIIKSDTKNPIVESSPKKQNDPKFSIPKSPKNQTISSAKKTFVSKQKTPKNSLNKEKSTKMEIEEPIEESKERKRLKKFKDVKESEEKLTRIPDNLLKKENQNNIIDEEEATQIEINRLLENMNEEELACNLDRFKFTQSTKPSSENPKIDEFMSKVKPKKTIQKSESIIEKKSPQIKYIIDENSNKTEILTEQLQSESEGEDFFEKLNNKAKKLLAPPKLNSPKKSNETNFPPQKIENKNTLITKIEPKSSFPQETKSNIKQTSTPNKSSFQNPKLEDFSLKPPDANKKKPTHNYGFSKPKIPPKQETIKKKTDAQAITGPLSKLTFVITGVLDSISREGLEDIIKSLGGRVTSNVSGKTSYLVAGNKLEDNRDVNTSAKYRKAVEIKTKILDEASLEDFLINKTGKTIDELRGSNDLGLNPIQKVPENRGGGVIIGSNIKTDTTASLKKENNQCNINIPSTNNNNLNQKNRNESSLWTHKYSPHSLSDLIGNGENVRKIQQWLIDWKNVVIKGEKKESKFQGKASNWSNVANLNARAALISGPPGIGKTTAIRVLCKNMGLELIEKNASDIRNKNAINVLLGELKSNQLINTIDKSTINRDFVILMDEVDGMSSDRGGSTALIEIIKQTKTPIICICNDRSHPKMRTLANHCYDIKFIKPNKQTIAKKIQEICLKEGLSLDVNTLELLCESLGNDIRQILNILQMWRRTSSTMDFMEMKNKLPGLKKDESVMISNFDAATRLLNKQELKKLNFRDKVDLFFIDYDLIPLLFQENYLSAAPKDTPFENIVKAADSISTSDIVSRSIRKNNDWGLMPNLAFSSTIFPGHLINGYIGFPKFPEWLGKNSSQRKILREIKELKISLASVVSGDRFAVKFEYADALLKLILNELNDNQIEKAIEIMEFYNITPEILKENLIDIQFNPKKIDYFSNIPSTVKSSLTKQYNKSHKDCIKATKKGKKVAEENEQGLRDPIQELDNNSNNENLSEEENEEKIENEIEIKTNTKVKTKAKTQTKKPSGKKK